MLRFLIASFLLAATFGARAEIVDIENEELASLMSAGVPVIDVRTAPEWEETGIVPGSHLLTFFDERGKADPGAWLGKAKVVAQPAKPVIVICRSGNRTKAVSQFLSQQGYGKVYNVKHGIRSWTKEGRQVIPAAPALASCRKAQTC
ncbi:MAG: Rhodanese domain-containing protein [Gallionellaceae bacterium]|nr:MAG: Rhodanese domain-containing protein [Gallionellaceae bacterium]